MNQFQRLTLVILELLQDPRLRLRALVGEGDAIEIVLDNNIGLGRRLLRRSGTGSFRRYGSRGRCACGRRWGLGLLFSRRLLPSRRWSGLLEEELLTDDDNDERNDENQDEVLLSTRILLLGIVVLAQASPFRITSRSNSSRCGLRNSVPVEPGRNRVR